MTLPAWLAWVIPLAALGGALVPLFVRLRKDAVFNARFEPVPLVRVPMSYATDAGTAPIAIGRAAELAVASICAHGPWTATEVERALAGLRIYVNKAETWLNTEGEKVGGETIGDIVYVGPSLKSLGHESGHRAEKVLTGYTAGGRMPDGSLGHPGWVANHLNDADRSYRAVLAA